MNPEIQNINTPLAPPTPPATAGQTQLTPPVTPEVPKPNNNLIIVLVTILILVVAGSLGYWAYQNYLTKQPAAPTTSATPFPTPTPTSDLTANWKIYTNADIGFSIKYPESWVVKPSQAPRLASFDTGMASGVTDPKTREFFIAYNNNISDLTKWLSDNQTGTIISSKTIGGNQFSVINGGAMFLSREYAIEIRTNNYIRFVLEPVENGKENEFDNLFNQILSTFKFTQ